MKEVFTIQRRQLLTTASGMVLSAALPGAAWANEAWKAPRAIRLVVPFPAGGTSDILARIIANAIGDELGPAIVVENRPGASGSIGSQAVSTAAPDGTTFVVATTDSHSIYPHVYRKQIFAAKEQIPVAPLAIIPFALLTRADLPVDNLKEFVELAKKQQLSYASWGNASAAHTAAIMLGRSAGIPDMLHVPYQGTAPAFQGVLASQVDFVMGPILLASSNKAKLKVLGVMAPERVASMPEVPTFAELGLPMRREGEFWIGVFAPPKTPEHIIKAVSQAINRAISSPAYKDRLVQLGLVSQVESADRYAKFYNEDYERWGKLVKETGIRAD